MNLLPIGKIEALDGGKKIAVDTACIGNGASRNAGDEITDPHDHPYQEELRTPLQSRLLRRCQTCER